MILTIILIFLLIIINKKEYEIVPLGEDIFKEEVLNDFKDE